jgi:nucleoside-diphosphate-sugar epimerase
MKRRKVLLLGASGLIAPHIIADLELHYDLVLADIKPNPDGRSLIHVDVTSYEQVHAAARGMDAIMNYTVNRPDPGLSFQVNTLGAWHVMKAAADHGIKKVLHSGPESVRQGYAHDFDIVDLPPAVGTNYYGVTKLLGREICRTYARVYGIHTVSFVFNALGPAPTMKATAQDFHPFFITYKDLAHACRLALEIESVPDYFQEFNMHSYLGQGKYLLDKARQILGYEPQQDWTTWFRRTF